MITLLLFAVFVGLVQNQEPLRVVSRPEVLLGNNTSIIEGSSVWLYCEVNSKDSGLRVLWMKNSSMLEEEVPHLRMRNLSSATSSSSSSTTFLLVIDNFRMTDSGAYQCVIQLGQEVTSGSVFNMKASPSENPGVLRIERSDSALTSGTPPDNRTTASVGSQVTFSFLLGRVPYFLLPFVPTLQWLKDGVPVRSVPVNTLEGRTNLNTELSFNVQESDAGDYQCIFYMAGTTVYLVSPAIRLDTSSAVSLNPVSPPLLILEPQEDLIIKVRGRGPYPVLNWFRNGIPLALLSTTVLTQFFETILVPAPSSSEEGLYQVRANSETVDFIASRFVNVTTLMESPSVTINESHSINLTCTATGVPTPSITWTFNNQIATLRQTVVRTEVSASANGLVTPGKVVSTLHLEEPDFPVHHGLYTCTGSNTHEGTSSNSTASSFVDIHAVPVVQVTTNPPSLLLGESVSLECNIQSGNPDTYSYTWKNLGGVLSRGLNSTLFIPSVTVLDIYDIFTCEVDNGVGLGKDSTIIRLGVAPNVSAELRATGGKNSPVRLGSTRVLTCTLVQGDTPDRVIWTTPTNKTLVPSGMDNQISVEFANSTAYGNYTCMAFNRFGSSTSTVEIREPGVLFQLRILNIRNCVEWVDTKRLEKLRDIASEISKDLSKRCGCEINPSELITNAGFKCFPDSPNRVTYRAQLNGLIRSGVTSSTLLNYLEEFVRSGPLLLAQGLLLQVDKGCPVAIGARNEPECESTVGMNLVVLISASVGGALVVTSLVLCVICMLCLYHLKRRQQRKHLMTGYPLKTPAQTSYKYNSPEHFSTESSQDSRPLQLPLEKQISTTQLDRTATAESIYYSQVDSTANTPSKKSSLTPTNDFTISHCPAYTANSRENSLELNEAKEDYTYSLNDAYNGDPDASRHQSSSPSSQCDVDDAQPSVQDKEECSIYQCPAYRSNELEEEVAVGSYHYARGNAFFMDEDGNILSDNSSHYVT